MGRGTFQERVQSLYLVYKMIYEKVKIKDAPNQVGAFSLPCSELRYSLYEQELEDYMLLLTACISTAELKHKPNNCNNNNLFLIY